MRLLITVMLLGVLVVGLWGGNLSAVTTAHAATGEALPVEQSAPALPEIVSLSYAWGPISSNVNLRITAQLHNPNSEPLTVISAPLKIFAESLQIGTAAKYGVSLPIPAGGNGTLVISAMLYSTKLGQVIHQHIDSGNHTTLTVQGDLICRIGTTVHRLPAVYQRDINFDALSYVNSTDPRSISPFSIKVDSITALWGTVTDTSVQVNMSAVVNNTSASAMSFDGLNFQILARAVPTNSRITVKDLMVLTSTVGTITLNPGDNTIPFSASVDTKNLTTALVNHLKYLEDSVVTLSIHTEEKRVPTLPSSLRSLIFGDQADNSVLGYIGLSGLNFGGEVKTHIIEYLNENLSDPF
jgi:LEA14-like dessication related protein